MQLVTEPVEQARVLEVQRCSLHDGPGIRTTVFLAGCNLRCAWCQNPEAFTGTRGTVRTVDDVFADVLADRAFFLASGGGLTVSGGEPLLQPAFVRALFARARSARITTCVQTAGNLPAHLATEIATLVDLFQIDLKHMDPVRHRELTGADNTRVLATITALRARGAAVDLRMPVVPGWNDEVANLERVAAFLASVNVATLHLVPYQRGYLHKYRELGLPARCAEVVPPGRDHLRELATRLAQRGISAVIDA